MTADPPNNSNRASTGRRPFVQLAKRLVVEREYGQAVDVCRQGLLVSPDEVEGRVVLCMALLAMGRADDVLREIRIALDQQPNNPIAHVLKGEAHYRRGQYARAEESLNRARRLDPGNPRADTLLRQVVKERRSDGQVDKATDPATRLYPANEGSDAELFPGFNSPEELDTDRLVGELEIPDLRFEGEEEDVETVAYSPQGGPDRARTLDVSVASATPRLAPPRVADYQQQDATVQDPTPVHHYVRSEAKKASAGHGELDDASELDSTRHYRPEDRAQALVRDRSLEDAGPAVDSPYGHGERLPESLGSTWGDLVDSHGAKQEVAPVVPQREPRPDNIAPRHRAPEYLDDAAESSSVVSNFSELGIEMLPDSQVSAVVAPAAAGGRRDGIVDGIVDHRESGTDAMTRVHFSDAPKAQLPRESSVDPQPKPLVEFAQARSQPPQPAPRDVQPIDSLDSSPFESLGDAWAPRERTAELSAFDGRASVDPDRVVMAKLDEGPRRAATAESFRKRAHQSEPRIQAPRAIVPTSGASDSFHRSDSVPNRDPKGTSFLQIIVGAKGSHRWIYWLLGITAVLVLAWVTGRWVRSSRLGDQATRKLDNAVTRAQRGNISDFRAALEIYGAILKRSNDSPEPLRHQALAQGAIPFEFGVPFEGKAVDLERLDEHTALIVRGYGHLSSGQYSRADALLKGAAAAGDDSRLLYLRGRLALLMGDPKLALPMLERAARKRPDDLLMVRSFANALLAVGDRTRAKQTYDQILAKNPDHVATLLALASAAISGELSGIEFRKNLQSILQGPRRSLSSASQVSWAKLLVALAEKSDKAEILLAEAENGAPRNDPAFLDALLTVHLENWRLDRVAMLLATAEKTMAGLPIWAVRKSELLLVQGKVGAARSLLQPLVKGRRAAILMARIELAGGRADVARKVLAAYLTEADTATKLVQAQLLVAEGKRDQAETLAQKLLAAGVRSAQLGLILGDIDLRAGRVAQALTHYQAVVKAHPQARDAKMKACRARFLSGEVPAAQAMLAEMSAGAGSSSEVVSLQAELHAGLFELSAAEQKLNALWQEDPSDRQLAKRLLRVLISKRDYRAAADLLGRIVGLGLSGEEKSLVLGQIALGRFEKTAEAHLSAAARGARGAEASELLLRFYLQTNNGRKAQQLADEIAKTYPDSPEALRAQGRADLFSGAFDSARSWIDRALAVGKRRGRTPRWFSETLLLRGQTKQEQGNSKAAQKDYRLAKDTCPACAGPYWRLGLLLDEAGKSEAAINALRLALERDSQWPRPHYDLARALDNAGKTDQAIQMYRKFLGFNPPADLAKDARQAIAALQ